MTLKGGGAASGKNSHFLSEEEEEVEEEKIENIVEEKVDVDQLVAEAENDFVGECAVDLFIDQLNPLSKRIHSTLKTTLERQREAIEVMKKQRAEQRAEEIRQQGVVIRVLLFIFETYIFFKNIRFMFLNPHFCF